MSEDRLVKITGNDHRFIATIHRLLKPLLVNRNKHESFRTRYHQCIFHIMKLIKSFSDQRIVRLSYLSPLFRKICELRHFKPHWRKKLKEQSAEPQYRLSLFKTWVGSVYANAHRRKWRKLGKSKEGRKVLSDYLERGVIVDSFYAFSYMILKDLDKVQLHKTNAVIDVMDCIKRNEEQVRIHGAPACFLLAHVYIKLGDNYLIASRKNDNNPCFEALCHKSYQLALQHFYQAWILEPHSSAAIQNAFLGKTIFEAFNHLGNQEIFSSWKQTCDDYIRLHPKHGLDVAKAKRDAAKAVAATVLELKEAKASL